jgi:hypothetical protein
MSRDAVWRRVGLESVGEEEWKLKFRFSDGHGREEIVEVTFGTKKEAQDGDAAALQQLALRLGGRVHNSTVLVPRSTSFV